MNVTAWDLAMRCVGLKEVPGSKANHQIMAMLRLDDEWPQDDEVPWCSGFVNYIAWWLRLPRSKSLRARSWLRVGAPVEDLADARRGFDVVVLKRGGADQPGSDVIDAPGHVGFFGGVSFSGADKCYELLGGNQSNAVSVRPYPAARLLGIRRLYGGP